MSAAKLTRGPLPILAALAHRYPAGKNADTAAPGEWVFYPFNGRKSERPAWRERTLRPWMQRGTRLCKPPVSTRTEAADAVPTSMEWATALGIDAADFAEMRRHLAALAPGGLAIIGPVMHGSRWRSIYPGIRRRLARVAAALNNATLEADKRLDAAETKAVEWLRKAYDRFPAHRKADGWVAAALCALGQS